jgi:hypothetical protein
VTTTRSFERVAGGAALALGPGGIAYSAVFLVFLHSGSRGTKIADSALLLAGGLGTSVVLVALYSRLRETDQAFALWGALVGIAGAIGSTLHGGFDLASEIRRIPLPELSQADPRGLATFGLTALGLAVMSFLMLQDRWFPRGLGQLGLGAAGGLLLTFVGRISLYNPHRPVLLTLLVVVGFVLTPAWYGWLGLHLFSSSHESPDGGP